MQAKGFVAYDQQMLRYFYTKLWKIRENVSRWITDAQCEQILSLDFYQFLKTSATQIKSKTQVFLGSGKKV